jgi:hypothetical protein
VQDHVCPWRRVLTTVVVAAIAIAPLPATAGERLPAGPPVPGLSASMQKAVAAEVTATRGTAARRGAASAAAQTDLGSPSFFKTPAGVITLVAVAAGVGYAIYSTSHDRVKSPAK